MVELIPVVPARADRYPSGKALRDTVPRESHAVWKASKKRRDPIDINDFDTCPNGDGFKVEVNEFDYRKENEVCYDKDGVTVRH